MPQSIISEEVLLDKLGPAPTISQTAKFLGESITTTWRRVATGELERIKAKGVARISLRSLASFINSIA
jgi:hypothetical protein